MVEIVSSHKCFEGEQRVYKHHSEETKCEMTFAIYLPPRAKTEKVPLLYWLSGLTCTHENFIFKSGFQRVASALGLAVLCPDTSPRGLGLPGEDDSYDFGSGAGFYVDALVSPWNKNYRMYSYITHELPQIVQEEFAIDSNRVGIMGHSMGGHGALTIGIKNPELFQSISAFSPICSPMQAPWGQKAFSGYLGDDMSSWQDYDAVELVSKKAWRGPELLIDFGQDDQFLKEELLPEKLQSACEAARVPLNLRIHPGYDHSYYFIASFIEEHLRYHASIL